MDIAFGILALVCLGYAAVSVVRLWTGADRWMAHVRSGGGLDEASGRTLVMSAFRAPFGLIMGGFTGALALSNPQALSASITQWLLAALFLVFLGTATAAFIALLAAIPIARVLGQTSYRCWVGAVPWLDVGWLGGLSLIFTANLALVVSGYIPTVWATVLSLLTLAGFGCLFVWLRRWKNQMTRAI